MNGRTAAGLGAVVAMTVAAGAWWFAAGGAADDDDFDYAAAFEALEPGSTAPLLTIADIAGRDEAAVAEVLGPPSGCEASRYSRRCRYAPGDVEIVYIDGLADWMTVNSLGDSPLDDSVLARIGLTPTAAAEATEVQRTWRDLPLDAAGNRLREVQAVGGPERVRYLRIKVRS